MTYDKNNHIENSDLKYCEYIGAALPIATSLPEGYPAYCIYIPTGWNLDSEFRVLAKLKEWGISMGSNLLVAPWDIGDISYRVLVQKLEISQVPSIILTDVNKPDKNSLLIKIDDPADVNNVERLVEILPNLVNHILSGNSKMLLKDAIRDRRNSKIRSILKPISSTLKRIKKLKISIDGVEIELA